MSSFDLRSAPGEERILIDEAKSVAPGVGDIEGAFAPRSHDDFAGAGAMNVLRRKTVQLSGARIDFFEVAYREVNVVGERFRLFATSGDVDERQNYRAAIDVVSLSSRNHSPRIVKQLGIKISGFVQIVDLQNYAEELISHSNHLLIHEGSIKTEEQE